MGEYISGCLPVCVRGYLGGLLNFFVQDPVMPSQEPPSDAKSEEVDLPPDDAEDTDGSKTLRPFFFLSEQCSRMLACYWLQSLYI